MYWCDEHEGQKIRYEERVSDTRWGDDDWPIGHWISSCVQGTVIVPAEDRAAFDEALARSRYAEVRATTCGTGTLVSRIALAASRFS